MKMELEVTEWSILDSLREPRMIFYYMEAELEEADSTYAPRAIANVIAARGGPTKLAAETGVSQEALEEAAKSVGVVDRRLMTQLMEAFRPECERVDVKSKVA